MVSSKNFITLDLQKQSTSVIVPLKHGENGKQIVISIADGGFPYAISNDCYAVLTAQKPDGNVLYNHCTINENTIIYDITEQTTAVVGTFPAAINLYGADDTLLISSKFRFIVDGTIYSEDEVLSAPETSALTHLISEATTTIATGNQTIQEGIAATESANTAAQSANEATNSANAAAGNANNSAAAANASAERANTATNSANTAAGNAQTATQAANSAAASANEAAGKTNKAIETANDAAVKANEATKNADEAATKAAQTAKSLMVVGKAEGTSINLDDAVEQFLVGCRIFGKTTQDGTPTLANPVELASVGDSGSITVNVTGEKDAQSTTLTTPNGLSGVPVTSGGNHTDADGQQWISDVIDLAMGVNVQSAEMVDMGTLMWEYDSVNSRFLTNSLNNKVKRGTRTTRLMTSIGYDCKYNSEYLAKWDNAVYVAGPTVYIHDANYTTVEAFAAAVSGGILLYPFETPIETPLSEEEIAAYNALRTYRDHTTVTNDAGAYMELEYAMDAKKYIDSQISGTILPATVE